MSKLGNQIDEACRFYVNSRPGYKLVTNKTNDRIFYSIYGPHTRGIQKIFKRTNDGTSYVARQIHPNWRDKELFVTDVFRGQVEVVSVGSVIKRQRIFVMDGHDSEFSLYLAKKGITQR